ncbi:MAG: hypothetical protein LBJ63_03790 [Prevotellaceae bacterium]|jgi:hypothetical protein|nr:hypothetical protein [Prevotellaceae bacterium]
MNTFYKLVKVLLAALFICLILDSCASRYSGGRYRPRKSKNCDCPAYSHNTMQNNISFFAPEEQKKL